MPWRNETLIVIRKSKNHTYEKLTSRRELSESWYQLDIHDCSPLRWRQNELDGVSNHQPHDYLPDRLFWHRSKKTSKPRVTGLCAGNSPRTGEFPTQMASNAENVSIWWRHHAETAKEDTKKVLTWRSLVLISEYAEPLNQFNTKVPS